MKKLLKKTGKMLLLYAAFGLLTALVFTATGAGGNLVVKSALGSMSPGTYIWLMFLVAVYWLPAAVQGWVPRCRCSFWNETERPFYRRPSTSFRMLVPESLS